MTIDNMIEQLEKEIQEAVKRENMYRAELEKYQKVNDYNTAAWYEHLMNCEIKIGFDLSLRLIKLAREAGIA